MKRVFCAGFGTETNTFSPLPTSMDSYKSNEYYPAGTYPDMFGGYAAALYVARRRAAELGWEVVQGMISSSPPGGVTTRVTYETLRDELLDDLRKAMPVDLVLLGLHGAMVADGYDDCEGDVLQRVREIVGPDAIIGAELDLHAHLTYQMVDKADVLVLYKEYPHTDILARAEELVELCAATMQGKIKPVPALVDCEMIVPIHTTREPGKSVVKRQQELEGKDGILSVSIAHGFATGDVPEMGTRVLVYSDGDEQKAKATARMLADELIAKRESFLVPYRSVDQAIDEALAFDGAPVVLADRPDNPGSGAPGDSTFVLQRLLERGIKNAALGPLWDPGVVRIAFDVQPGARLPLRIGGKIGPLSGQPVDAMCTVKAVAPNYFMTGLDGAPKPMGDSALIDVDGVDVVVCSLRQQALNVDLFTNLGCDISSKKIVVVKSAQHFHASFSKVAAHIIYVGGQGVATPEWHTLTYHKIKRPKWPIDR